MSIRMIALIILSMFILAGCAAAEPGTQAEDKGMEATLPPAQNTPVPAPVTDAPLEPKPGETTSAGEGERSPLDPLPNESEMARGNVFVDESSVVLMESYPVQAALLVSGSLPTPCHELRATVSEPDEENKIYVELFSITDPNMACIQMLEQFSTSIPLGSYTSGSYTVYLNGEEVGEINL